MVLHRFLILSLVLIPLSVQEIVFKQPCVEYQGDEYALLHRVTVSKDLFLVNTQSLQTLLRPIEQLSGFRTCKEDSLYQDLRKSVLDESKGVVNRGLKDGNSNAYALSVDMCPSSKAGMDSDFFKALLKSEKPFPVTLSITKRWATTHRQAFEQLKAWDDKKMLDITWVNHGASHPYKPGVPIEKNFINLNDVDFKKEVLDNEAFLFEEGRVPSVFYRFAGLVSNERDLRVLVEDLGLIPVGSNAWLAKGEKIQAGSIVLVHGNKNEPLGIRRFLEATEKPSVIELTRMFSKE